MVQIHAQRSCNVLGDKIGNRVVLLMSFFASSLALEQAKATVSLRIYLMVHLRHSTTKMRWALVVLNTCFSLLTCQILGEGRSTWRVALVRWGGSRLHRAGDQAVVQHSVIFLGIMHRLKSCQEWHIGSVTGHSVLEHGRTF